MRNRRCAAECAYHYVFTRGENVLYDKGRSQNALSFVYIITYTADAKRFAREYEFS